MYLSKIDLDLHAESVRQSLRDCGDLHRNVQRWFASSRSEAGVLYRLNSGMDGCCLYVLSDNEPEANEMTFRNGMSLAGCRDMSLLEARFENGTVFSFDLLTMPCRKKSDGVSKNSRRVCLTVPEEREKWLERKAAENGFEILSCQETAEGVMTAHRKEGTLYLHPMKYVGMLRITDSEMFRSVWQKGIGPEKAYGLGMLMVR